MRGLDKKGKVVSLDTLRITNESSIKLLGIQSESTLLNYHIFSFVAEKKEWKKKKIVTVGTHHPLSINYFRAYALILHSPGIVISEIGWSFISTNYTRQIRTLTCVEQNQFNLLRRTIKLPNANNRVTSIYQKSIVPIVLLNLTIYVFINIQLNFILFTPYFIFFFFSHLKFFNYENCGKIK